MIIVILMILEKVVLVLVLVYMCENVQDNECSNISLYR